MKIEYAKKIENNAKLLIVTVFGGEKLNSSHYSNWLKRRIDLKEFKAKSGELLMYYSDNNGEPEQTLIVGMGKKEKICGKKVRKIIASAVKQIKNIPKKYHLFIEVNKELSRYCQEMGEAVALGNFRMDIYKSGKAKKSSEEKELGKCTFVGQFSSEQKKCFEKGLFIGQTVNKVRNYINAPHNVMDVEAFTKEAKRQSKLNGFSCKVLEKKKLEAMGMGGLLGINRGSEKGAKMLVLNFIPLGKKHRPIALVGKGVTFDTGGLNIKPEMSMDWMKMDMAGAAVVLGVFSLLKKLNIQKNIVGIIPLTDNAVDAKSIKPNDILQSYSKKTIEILHTDAEGRVILADAITHAIKDYNASIVVDLATLTGACLVALGTEYAGLFGNDKRLIEDLLEAGKKCDEELWQLPIHNNHRKSMKGKFTDLQNISGKRTAGSSTAAAFLEYFAEKTPWAHIDIAGVAKPDEPKEYEHENSASGFGVRLILRWLSDPNN